MKRVLLGVIGLLLGSALQAVAADLPTKAPVTNINWTGCYIGVEGGGNWGRTNSVAVTAADSADVGLPLTGNYGLKGGLAGGTIGCDYQAGMWVFGLADDMSWTNQSGAGNDVAPFNTVATNRISEDWIDTLTGRVGFTVERALIYGSVGAAFAGTTDTICAAAACIADSQNRAGFAVGGGVEYALLPNVSIKFDYLHADFGSKNFVNTPISLAATMVDTRSVNLSDDMFRAGVNWRFYAAPADVAKN